MAPSSSGLGRQVLILKIVGSNPTGVTKKEIEKKIEEVPPEIKKELVAISSKLNNPNILEAEFNTLSNDTFHKISDSVTQEVGIPLSTKVFPLWQDWLNKQIKAKRI